MDGNPKWKAFNPTSISINRMQLLVAVLLLAAASASSAVNPNLKYFSVWSLETGTPAEIGSWSNFLFTSRNATQLQAYHAATKKASLLNIDWVLFNGTRLYDDVDERWQALLAATLQPLLDSGAAFGVFLGDELCWQCISYANLTYAVNMVRASLPRGKAIIYYNEAYPVFTDDFCGSTTNGTRVHYDRVPAGLDWISVDYYPDEGTFEGAQKIFRELVYPKMAAGQGALFVPPAYGAPAAQEDQLCCNSQTRDGPNPPCGGNCEAAMEQWARASYDWARSDERIVGLTPWHYDTWAAPGPFNPGMTGMGALLTLWQTIGAEIVNGTLRDV